MPQRTPIFTRGQKVRAADMRALAQQARAQRPTLSFQDVGSATSAGADLAPAQQRPSMLPIRQPLELYDVGRTVFKIRGGPGDPADNALMYVAGAPQTITAGTLSFNTSTTISDSTYIYIKMEYADGGPTITLEKGTSKPSGGDGTSPPTNYWLLWYLEWNANTEAIEWIWPLWGLPREDRSGN